MSPRDAKLVERAQGKVAGDPGARMAEHHRMERWVYPVLLILAAWLASGPALLGYDSLALAASDIASGVVLAALTVLGFRGRGWAAWAIAALGVWLLFAPLVFSAASAAAYANDNLVGLLVIGFAVLVPHRMETEGRAIPPGWSYNPSTWTQRAPIIALALLGYFISRYLAAYQLGHVDSAWDPFFGAGTERILTSDVSRAFPVSDAGLGAFVYALEALMGLMGGVRRWRTMPWMVAGFGLLVIPLGATQIILIMLQPIAVGTWCTLCLVSAGGMLMMIPLALDEVIAMGQFLSASRRQGRSLWRTFWRGGDLDGEDRPAAGREQAGAARAAFWGLSLPPTLPAAAAAGAWLLLAPGLLGHDGAAANNDYLVGALVVTGSVDRARRGRS